VTPGENPKSIKTEAIKEVRETLMRLLRRSVPESQTWTIAF